jgi:hypothetical protein
MWLSSLSARPAHEICGRENYTATGFSPSDTATGFSSSDTATGFSPSASVFPCQYHSTNAKYSFITIAIWSSTVDSVIK